MDRLPVDRREDRLLGHTLLDWVRRAEMDAGKVTGLGLFALLVRLNSGSHGGASCPI